MGRGANRRKLVEPTITIASTSTSGTTGDSDNAGNHDAVIYFVSISAITGNITFVIQMSADDGTTWCSLATAEMNGDTGAITTTGGKHVSAWVPFGTRTRLSYTIVTGPVAFTVIPVFAKNGSVN